jgi:hypothetical protein
MNESYEITPELARQKTAVLRDLLNNVQRHHGMNFPNSILGQSLSAV